jgi:hypothetical protein
VLGDPGSGIPTRYASYAPLNPPRHRSHHPPPPKQENNNNTKRHTTCLRPHEQLLVGWIAGGMVVTTASHCSQVLAAMSLPGAEQR